LGQTILAQGASRFGTELPTMRALLVVAPCLCHLGSAAAGFGVLDQASLLQKGSKLQPADADLSGDARVSGLLAAFAKQVSGMEGMLESGNFTQDALDAWAAEVEALEDEDFAVLESSALLEVLKITGSYMKNTLSQMSDLHKASMGASEAESCKLLAAFLKIEKTQTFETFDAVFTVLKAVRSMAPAALNEALGKLGGGNTLDEIADDMKKAVGDVFNRVITSASIPLVATQQKSQVADLVNDMPKTSVRQILTSIDEVVHKTIKTATKQSHCSSAHLDLR